MVGVLAYLPAWYWIAVGGVFGTLVGSFLNVVILRLPPRVDFFRKCDARVTLGLSPVADAAPLDLVVQHSRCPRCQHRLAPWDNIPLISWLLLRGRCRYCRSPISLQYPVVEALTGLASAAAVWRFGASLQGAAALLCTWLLVAAGGTDWHARELPETVTMPLLWVGLLAAVAPLFVTARSALLGAAIGYAVAWAAGRLIGRSAGERAVRRGAVELVAAVGAWLGAGALLPVLALAALGAAAVRGLLAYARRRPQRLAFGPFVATAMWIWLLRP